VGVYGLNSNRDRRLLWDEFWYAQLVEFALMHCDFNITRFPSERSGNARLCPAMVDFS
jgi:hypothetical protein